MITLPPGFLPVRDRTTREILYGPRTTTFRYELLVHDATTGADTLAGFLDGVKPGGSLSWSAAGRVKKSGNLTVLDLSNARPGMKRFGDINPVTIRLRPVRLIEGLPETPLGVYVVTAAPEAWSAAGRTFRVEMHDKSTVLDQDAFETTYTAPTGVRVLEIIRQVVVSAGERIDVDASDLRTLAAPMVWEAGTSKLTIVNDLLKVIDYNALWVDGVGAFRATKYLRPAERPTRYTMLNDEEGERIVRELTDDGDASIYSPDWARDRDAFDVPNKVVAVQQGAGSAAALSDFATNEDPTSPFSYQARGRWVVRTLTGVEVPDYSAEADPVAATKAFLKAYARRSLIAASAVQAAVSVKCLPIPIELLEAVRFSSTPADIDERHTVQNVEIPLRFDGLISLELQEVIDL